MYETTMKKNVKIIFRLDLQDESTDVRENRR